MATTDKLGLNYSSKINITNMGEAIQDLTLSASPASLLSISGTVRDKDTNQPIANATVKTFLSDGTPFAHVYTNNNGDYTISGHSVNTTYLVASTKSGYLFSTKTSVTLSTSSLDNIDLVMSADTSSTLSTVAGIVTTVSDDATVISGASVDIFAQGSSTAVAHTITADDGEFVFSDLAAGAYTLTFTKQGYQTISNIQTTVAAGGVSNLNVTMSVDSNTHYGTINGVIKDATNNNAPVAGCFVGLYKVGEDKTESLVAVTKTNLAGEYMFGQVAEGNYIVKAKKNVS